MYQDSPKTIEGLNLSATSFHSRNSQDVFCFTGSQNATNCPNYAQPLRGDKRKAQLESYTVPSSSEDIPPRKVYFSEAAMSNYFAQMNLKSYKPSDFSIDCCQSTSFVIPQPVLPDEDVEFENTVVDDDSEEQDADPPGSSNDSPTLVLSNDLKEHIKSYKCDDPVEKIIRGLLTPKPELALVPYNPNNVSPFYRNPVVLQEATKGASVIEQHLQQGTVTPSNLNFPHFAPMESESISSLPSCFNDLQPVVECTESSLLLDNPPWIGSQPAHSRSCFPVTSASIATNIFSIPYSSQGQVASQSRHPVYGYQSPSQGFRFPYN